MRILVTGTSGFIGSHFAKRVLRDLDKDTQVIAFSRHSDQGNLQRLSDIPFLHQDRVRYVYGDLCDRSAVSGLCEGIDVVVNFAAKTFVDHSLKDDEPFWQSNVIGAKMLMDDARRYGVKRFVQVSTDEVYGQILTGAYKEDAMLQPRNPYCVHPSSIVITPTGPRKIEEISIGDLVQGNSDGRNGFFKVKNKWVKESRDAWYVVRHSYGSICVSGQHGCFAAVPQRGMTGKLRQISDINDVKPMEIQAKDLEKGMWMCVARTVRAYAQENNITAGKLRFLGFYVGNGCCKVLPSGKNHCISTCSGYRHVMEFYKNLVKSEFGNDVKLHKHSSKECWYHDFGNLPLWNELLLNYGRSSLEKTCSPLLKMGLSGDQIAEFLAGYFDADGSFSPHKISYSSHSKQLLVDVRFLLARIGILSTMQMQIKDGNINPSYSLNITDAKSMKIFRDVVPQCKAKIFCEKKGQRTLSSDEYVYSTILSVEKVLNEIGVMIDIEVEESSNFYCDYALVHNSWSKACADLYAVQLHRTHGFPVIITRTENNFGPWQHRQKALPTFTRQALNGQNLSVYGDGLHVRCWLHVEEHCRAILHLIQTSLEAQRMNEEADRNNHNFRELIELTNGAILKKMFLGEIFHIAGEQEMTNIDLARLILRTLGKPEDRIRLVPDHDVRPGHDRRYALDCSKLKATGFEIVQDLPKLLGEAVMWYANHPEWMR